MIVCHCKAVTDRTIRKAVRNGARTRSEIASACAASTCCGGCAPAIDEILEAETRREPSFAFPALAELAVSS